MLLKRHRGYVLALLGSGLIAAAGIVLAISIGLAVLRAWMDGAPFGTLVASPLPVVVFVALLATVAGTAFVLVALAIYEYRSGWFWYALICSSVLWLFAVPMGTVIGAASLVMLIRCRHSFLNRANRADRNSLTSIS